ncbi:MAG TPA: hypothetical protein VF916_15690 [Ktedonobacterales bacterium]
MAQQEPTSVIPYALKHPALVLPVADADEVRAAIRAYEDMKMAILRPGDTINIKGKDHIKKSGWLRLARAFGLSVRHIRSELMQEGTDWGYLVLVEAMAPNGASMCGDGMCYASEKAKGMDTRHNVHAHAYTRASNRAISNLVGGGEVSAEELTNYVDADPSEAPADTHTIPSSYGPKRTDGQKAAASNPVLKMSWDALHARAARAGVVVEDWEALCVDATGKADKKLIGSAADYRAVETRVAAIERERRNQTEAAERVPAETLAELEPVNESA